MTIDRCLSVDWLEVYLHEPPLQYPMNADYFRAHGFHVVERAYGTPVYNEMFFIYGHDDQPMLEVRRNPKSAQGLQIGGVLSMYSCHVRLCNRTCYFNEPVQLLIDFIQSNNYEFQRISRIDLALDFEKFDYGDQPDDFMARFMKHRYSKINQAEIAAHGKDMWDGRIWNSLRWGHYKSMITTRFYNKTMEIRQVKDKPYIRQRWKAYGLVDDDYTLEKHHPDGSIYYPDIWRVEFAIKSSKKNRFVVEDCNGERPCKRSIRHDLQVYINNEGRLDVFFSLVQHYFHFKKFQEGIRKDRCPDKPLFRTDAQANFYKVERVAVSTERNPQLDKLLIKLVQYRQEHPNEKIYKACNVLIEDIEIRRRRDSIPLPWSSSELTMLRLLVAQRMKATDKPLSQDKEEIEAFLNVEDDIFGEVDD